MARLHKSQRPHTQRGATLVVALVILAVISLLGVAGIRSSSLELKMAASARDRSVAFQAAESALLTVERELMTTPPARSALLPDCDSSDASAGCFSNSCAGGRCFTGSFVGGTENSDCRLIDTGGSIAQPWRDDALWNDNNGHAVVNVTRTDVEDESREVKYMVEFMCFVLRDDIGALEADADPLSDAVPLYRVTVLAEGEADRARVMLQSTLSVPEA